MKTLRLLIVIPFLLVFAVVCVLCWLLLYAIIWSSYYLVLFVSFDKELSLKAYTGAMRDLPKFGSDKGSNYYDGTILVKDGVEYKVLNGVLVKC